MNLIDMMEGVDIRELLGITPNIENHMHKLADCAPTSFEKQGIVKKRKNILHLCGPGIPSLPASTVGPFTKSTRLETRVHKWDYNRFGNPARLDGLQLKHWIREDKKIEPYYPARFNRAIPLLIDYNDAVFRKYIHEKDRQMRSDWTQRETEYLMHLCNTYGLRWAVIHDRFAFSSSGHVAVAHHRSIEELKSRFYSVGRYVIEGRTQDRIKLVQDRMGVNCPPEIVKQCETEIKELKERLSSHPLRVATYRSDYDLQRKVWSTCEFLMSSQQRKASKRFRAALEAKRKKKLALIRSSSTATVNNNMPNINSGPNSSAFNVTNPNNNLNTNNVSVFAQADVLSGQESSLPLSITNLLDVASRPTLLPSSPGVHSIRQKVAESLSAPLLIGHSSLVNSLLVDRTVTVLDRIGFSSLGAVATPLIGEALSMLKCEVATLLCLQRAVAAKKILIQSKMGGNTNLSSGNTGNVNPINNSSNVNNSNTNSLDMKPQTNLQSNINIPPNNANISPANGSSNNNSSHNKSTPSGPNLHSHPQLQTPNFMPQPQGPHTQQQQQQQRPQQQMMMPTPSTMSNPNTVNNPPIRSINAYPQPQQQSHQQQQVKRPNSNPSYEEPRGKRARQT